MDRRRVALWTLLAGSALAATALGVHFGMRRLETALRRWVETGAVRHGLVVHLDAVHVRPWGLVAIDGFRLDKPGVGTLSLDRIVAVPRVTGPLRLGLRLALGRGRLTGPAGLVADIEPTRWNVDRGNSVHAELLAPVSGLELRWAQLGEEQRLEGRAQDLATAAVWTLRREGVPLVDPGRVAGTAALVAAKRATRFEADIQAAGARVAALARGDERPPAQPPPFGEPEDVRLAVEGSWHAEEGVLDLPRWRVASAAATLWGTLHLDGLPRDPFVRVSVQVDRVDFARLFRASGLDQPLGMDRAGDEAPAGALGSMHLEASAQGRLADAASFTVSQSLDFTPPRRSFPALARLRGEFVHHVTLRDGSRAAIELSPRSPDFVALPEVPPLFVRTLLLGEDAGFYGHRGVDLQALPEAVVTNWTRGGIVRGASTITQQLAKNLFLSNDRRFGRKVQELCLALLIEATLDKPRILEVYLNVIEWGPDLFGLRSAARRYFAREPQELTPRQMAFLVALVPGPTKYQRSFADGTPSPGFTRLVDNLLAKLHSVQALSDDEYAAALAEELVVAAVADRREP